MKLGELMEVCRYNEIRLHNGGTGKLVTAKRDTLKKFAEVELDESSVYCKLDSGRDGNYAKPYLFVYGMARSIEAVKEKLKAEEMK